MSLTELIAGVEAHRKTLTVFDADPAVVSTLRDQFADRNVVVRSATADGGPRNYAVLHEGETFVTAVGLDAVLAPADERSVGFAASSYRPVLDELDETLFTSYSIPRMVAASREIEDRAWRVGAGSLHAGFQTVSTLETQREVYDRLGARGDLSVHAYAYPDTTVDPGESFAIHPSRAAEIADSWFVVYDGGGADENACALLAEERPGASETGDERSFYGFWTYDPETVAYILSHLERTYVTAETDGDDGADGADTGSVPPRR